MDINEIYIDSLEETMIENGTEKNKRTFICEICDHTWCRKYDYIQHLKTTKHEKTYYYFINATLFNDII